MKSIVEEGSSITKAIEKAWLRAGKPQEFTVKVFEEAQKNFIGMTIKSAKIALFFKHIAESLSQPSASARSDRSETSHKEEAYKRERPKPSAPREHREPIAPRPLRSTSSPSEIQPRKIAPERTTEIRPIRPRTEWTPEMVAYVQSWMSQALQALDPILRAMLTVDDQHVLHIAIEGKLSADINDRIFKRSLAHLMMEGLAFKFKKQTRGLKMRVVSN